MAIYLDYNASAPIDERVLERMVDVYRSHYGNADSRTTHTSAQTQRNCCLGKKNHCGDLSC